MPSQGVCQDLMAGVENSMNTKNKEPLDPLDALIIEQGCLRIETLTLEFLEEQRI